MCNASDKRTCGKDVVSSRIVLAGVHSLLNKVFQTVQEHKILTGE